jgi:hypothetical protein
MRVPRTQFTLRAIMIAVAVAAIWISIIAEAIIYQARHQPGYSAWYKYP